MAWNTLRTLANRTGVVYDELKSHVIFAEDMNAIKENLEYLEDAIGEPVPVPTKTSDLENDSGFITASAIPEIPTATSDLENDSGFITSTNFSQYDILKLYQSLGSPLKAMAPVDISFVQSYGLISQRTFYYAFFNNYTGTITGVKFMPANTANYTGTNYNGIGLYSWNNGVLTRIAMTTNASNFWINTSGTLVSKAFSSPVSLTQGVYFLAFLYCSSSQTTAPTLRGYTVVGNNLFNSIDMANGSKLGGYKTSQTSLPTSVSQSTFTIINSMFWFGLY